MRSQISKLLKEKNPDNISIAEDISNAMAASKRGKLDGLTNIEAGAERLRNINWQYRFRRIVSVEQLPIYFHNCGSAFQV